MAEDNTLQLLSEKFDHLEKSFSTLKEQNDGLQQQNQDLADQNKSLHAQIAELSIVAKEAVSSDPLKIESKPPKLPAKPYFTFEKQRYQILIPAMHIPGIGYRTAEDILQDVKSQEALVKLETEAIRKA